MTVVEVVIPSPPAGAQRDIRGGYLLAGSGEVEMARVMGTVLAILVGLLLTALVAAGARLGARRPS